MTVEELHDRALVVASMRQARFTAAVGDRVWWVDPQNSVARMFTRDRQPASELLRIRLLGTEGGGEWLWAWANALNFPLPASRAYSEALRAARLGIPEFSTPRLPLDGVVGAETFAIIALGMPGTAGYVLHRAGPLTAAFVLAEPFLTPDEAELGGIGRAIASVLGGSHPYADAIDVIAGTFATLGLAHEIRDETVRARDGRGGSITISVAGGRFRCDIHEPGAPASS